MTVSPACGLSCEPTRASCCDGNAAAVQLPFPLRERAFSCPQGSGDAAPSPRGAAPMPRAT
eukprot:4330664-Pleurochrysis_carterae.AAC.2